jgi:hypothetical protein
MKDWRLWFGVVVSAVCLYLAAHGVDWGSLQGALRQVQAAPLLLALGLSLWIALARAYRWRAVLAPNSRPKIRRLFNLLNAGYFVSNVAPLRLGDVLRAYLLAELEHLSVVRALSTVVVERILDTLTIMVLLLVLVPVVSLPTDLLRPALGVGLVAVLALSLLGVGREGALSYALVLHALLYLSSSALGLLGLWIEGFSYARLKDVVARAQNGRSVAPNGRPDLDNHPGAPDGATTNLEL